MVACGDDELEPDDTSVGDEDAGQVDQDDLDALNDRLNDLEGQLSNVGDDVDGLGDQIGGLGDDVDGLGDDLSSLSDDVQGRLDDLENPEILSCADTQEELCIPDGIDLVAIGLDPIVTQLCRIEVGCCSETERTYKFGAGIATEEDCVEAFADLINNGFTPGFLRDTVGGATGGVIDAVISIAQTLNNAGVRVELNTDAIEACAGAVEQVSCPDENGLVMGDSASYATRCGGVAQDYLGDLKGGDSIDFGSCQLSEIVRGLQQEGEGCRRVTVTGLGSSNVNDCAPGLVCRNTTKGGEGICAQPPTVGDTCLPPVEPGDDDCDTGPGGEELYCDFGTSTCAAAGDVGDDCTLKDPTLTVLTSDGSFAGVNGPEEQARCKSGLRCDPDALKCVAECSGGHYCTENGDCGEGLICNKTANSQLTDQSGGWLGVCSEPIADRGECTVRNDIGLDGPLARDWLGDSECASGVCMEQLDYEGEDDAPSICAPRGATGDTCSHADTGVADNGLDSAVRAETYWECQSGYCGPDLKCGVPCGSSSSIDLEGLADFGICPPDGAADALADYPFLEELYVELLTEDGEESRWYAAQVISNTLTCADGHYCDDRHFTYGVVGLTSARLPVCRPLELDEDSCGSPADLNDIEDSDPDVQILGDFPGLPFDVDFDEGSFDESDLYGDFDEWEEDRKHGGSCASGQCFDGDCATIDGLGDLCDWRGGSIPYPNGDGYSYGHGDGDDWRALTVFNPSVEHDTCQPGLFCDPRDEDLTFALGARCRDRVAEGGDCRDNRRNICADGLVCLNVDDAFGNIVVGDSTLRVEVDDFNWGGDYGSGVIVNIFENEATDAPPFVNCANDYLNVTLGADSGLPTNNSVTEIASLINDLTECSEAFNAIVTVGDGEDTVTETISPAVVLEGAYTCVTPPSAIGDTCAFGDRGVLSCHDYGVDGTCGEESGLCDAPLAANAECDNTDQCALGLVCSPINGRCVEPGDEGANCTVEGSDDQSLCRGEAEVSSCGGEEPPPPLSCVRVDTSDDPTFECWEPNDLPNDAPCDGDYECASGFCLDVTVDEHICAPRIANGEACDRRRIANNEGGTAGEGPVTESCLEDSYCDYPVDGDVGTCEPKGGTAAPCQPYFSLGGSNSWDCLSNICTLQNDRYQCAPWDGDQVLLCGEEVSPDRVFDE